MKDSEKKESTMPLAPEPSVGLFWLPYIVPALTFITQYSPNPWHALIPYAFIWVLIPIIDFFIGVPDEKASMRLTTAQRRDLEARPAFRMAVFFWVPMQLALLVWSMYLVSLPSIHPVRALGLFATMGLIACEGINVSHEMLHRPGRVESAFGHILLISSCYGHFFIEHAKGHHKYVATPDDPATMRRDENFFTFLPRTVFHGFLSAWEIEKERLKREGRSTWGVGNSVLWYVVLNIGLFVLPTAAVFGARGLTLFFFQAGVSIVLTEQVNAIEHYGLRRKLISGNEDDRFSRIYEPVGPEHSWELSNIVSNYFMFKLQRHADHHMHAGKRYHVLEITPESPQLPYGYLTLMPCILMPPLWRAIIDPVLDKYEKELAARKANAGISAIDSKATK